MDKQNEEKNENRISCRKRKFVDVEPDSMDEKKCRGLSAELLNELFASLPLENAFVILANMPNGLLARNVRKMLKSFKMAIKNIKLNVDDCGPILRISNEGLEVKHFGPDRVFNCVRCKLTIPMMNLNANKLFSFVYFEVEILESNRFSIDIGFCTKKFPLEGEWLGNRKNSIGIDRKGRMRIDGSGYRFGNDQESFQAGDIVGLVLSILQEIGRQ